MHASRELQVVFGVRGVMGLELTVFGPAKALHSGHYGNWAPNPGMLLADLVTSLRDVDGRILVRGFYDDVVPPSAAELVAARSLPPVDAALKRELLLGGTEAGDALLAERIMLPAHNVRGMRVGQVEALASNAVPVEAKASIDFRLVPKQTPERIRELVAPYFARHPRLVFDHRARTTDRTRLEELAPRWWRATQVLVDPEEENDWFLEAEIDLRDRDADDGPLLTLVKVAT